MWIGIGKAIGDNLCQGTNIPTHIHTCMHVYVYIHLKFTICFINNYKKSLYNLFNIGHTCNGLSIQKKARREITGNTIYMNMLLPFLEFSMSMFVVGNKISSLEVSVSTTFSSQGLFNPFSYLCSN